jgi:hypothetical protein
MKTKLEPKPKPLGPHISPEAHLAMAKNAHSEITRVVAEMRASKHAMFEALAALVGQPGETDRSRLIWAGLVMFVNESLTGQPLQFEVAAALRATIALCIYGNHELEDLQGEVYGLGVFEDIYQLQKRTKVSVDEAFSTLATELQPQLRNLLEWIADPNRMSPQGRMTALSFLLEHGEQELARYTFDPNDEFDDTGNVGYPLFFWKRPQSFETVDAPIARFIFERLELYHDGELKLDDAAPIVLCKRDGCGRISLSQRKTKDFCSPSCRTLHRQKEKPEEHAAYMRRYRQDNYSKPFPTRKRKPTIPS